MGGFQNGVGVAQSFNLTDGVNSSQIKLTNGNPEGVVTGTVGSLGLDYTNGILYRKQSGTGNTGWEPVGSGANGWTTGNNCAFKNLSFTHSAGTLTLAGEDGTALSASNPGYVLMPSNSTDGRMVLHTISANDTLTVSNMAGNIFGTTASTAWGSAMPLYIGFMADSADANLEPVICRLPHMKSSPASSANIGDPSAANADQEYSVFAWNDITEANYQSMALGLIGSLRATKDASDVWTLTALDDGDGVGRFNDQRTFSVPLGQNGASSGTYFKPNSGTAPVFTNNFYRYHLAKDGQCIAHLRMQGDGGTDGNGAVVAFIATPLRAEDLGDDALNYGSAQVSSATGGTTGLQPLIRSNTAPTSIELLENTSNGSVLNGDFTNGSRNLEMFISYKVAVS